jgi:hypothetical protein
MGRALSIHRRSPAWTWRQGRLAAGPDHGGDRVARPRAGRPIAGYRLATGHTRTRPVVPGFLILSGAALDRLTVI